MLCMSGDRRSTCHGERPPVSSARALFPSGRQRDSVKLITTAWATYKLEPQHVPLGNCVSSKPTLSSDRFPQLPNLGFPPNRSKNAAKPSSPWAALHRSDNVVFDLVPASLCVPITHRPNQFLWAGVDHREHLDLFPGCMVIVARANHVAIDEIRLGKTSV
jgi:hypothetical protein